MAVHLSRSHSQGRLCFLAWALIVLLCFVSVESEEQTCTADGSCKATQSEETSENDIPPFPVADAEGYLTIKYGEKQKVEGTKADETLQRAREVHNYMYTKVFKTTNGGDDKNLLDVAHDCLNRHELCTFWAAIGECEANPAYMKLQCAPACLSCDQLSFETRCPYDKDAPKAWNPGDLHRMFERITADEFYQQYEPHVLGKPGMKVGPLTDAPWVVVLDKFLTDEECETLIRLGGEQGYEISKDVGNQKFDGTYDSYENSGRTSTNAWCLNACYDDAVTQRILQKIENLTGIPDQNSEYLQLLRYEPEQFYQVHHDYIPHHVNRQQGVRILTVFLYLNDVEEGGGTNFPVLDLTVEPRKGRALLWPSVKNDHPDIKDSRTDHQALPVKKGIKYGANAWLHQGDFKTPYKKSCI